jgi:predicted CopG family antitoxin
MARGVSLSDDAFTVLRSQKRPGESDSDVVLRLAGEARARRKDPMAFFRTPPKPRWSPSEYDEFRRRMREADVEKARRLSRSRGRGA